MPSSWHTKPYGYCIGKAPKNLMPDSTRIIHDSSSRNRQDATRDGHAERRGTKAYLKQYVEVTRNEPARLAAAKLRPGLS
ncbi:MAG: hypothetical protein KF751_19855 [Nitrospira sp.]|nr:hypothetical protein [Nitrospira sp.]